jgi:hypothetical protein
VTSTPRTITEDELAKALHVLNVKPLSAGEKPWLPVDDPETGARVLFDLAKLGREPDYEPGVLVVDDVGDVYRRCNEMARDMPWLGFGGHLHAENAPCRPLRKLVPEGSHEAAAVLAAEWRGLGEQDDAVPAWRGGYRAALRKCADELEYALKHGGSGD